MINKFEIYLKAGKVKKKTIDPEESSALFERAKSRLKFIKEKEITEEDAPFILEGAYESLREAAQSLMSLKGFKPYSHEATIAFIKENHSEFDEEVISEFDRFRKIRNNSAYSAEKVSKVEATECVELAKVIIGKVKGIINF